MLTMHANPTPRTKVIIESEMDRDDSLLVGVDPVADPLAKILVEIRDVADVLARLPGELVEVIDVLA